MIHGRVPFWDEGYDEIVEEAQGVLWKYIGRKEKLQKRLDRGERLQPFEERELQMIRDAEAVIATPRAKRSQDSIDSNKWDFKVNRGGK